MPLAQRPGDTSESRYSGVETAFSNTTQHTLAANIAGGFDFILAPLVDPNSKPILEGDNPTTGSVSRFAGSDLVLTPSQWSSHVVGKISSWCDPDSEDPVVVENSELTLKQELSWAAHLSLQACLLPPPRPLDCGNYARVVQQVLVGLAGNSSLQLWLRVPLLAPALAEAEGTPAEDHVFLARDPMGRRPLADTWEWWNVFRGLAEHHPQLHVALDVGASLPPPGALQRWWGESVKAIILHTDAFLTNKRGFPCLSKRHQAILHSCFEHNVQVVLSGHAHHGADDTDMPSSSGGNGSEGGDPPPAPRHPLKSYLDYVSHLYRRQDPVAEQARFEASYRDFLQAPLQPLMDNLEAQTYETFERDATKYSQYHKAVHAALMDRVADADAATTTTVLMVVGAGRGPLVRASLAAAEAAGRRLRVYAVEKNPNAVVTLRHLVALEGWGERVTVVGTDMRKWDAPERADILVSELLGSFGDNELSPECLDGAQRFLKPDGISIPFSYTSFLQPLTAAKLHNDVKAYADLAHFETAYVVKLHNVAYLAPPQKVFTFEHPNWAEKIDNRRYSRLSFELSPDTGSALVHGLGGYFDAVLYKDIHLGIEPSTATPNMFSWFAIFFPLRQPVYVPTGMRLEVHMWRCVGPTKVWYEWAVTAPQASHVHNPNGRSYWVGL